MANSISTIASASPASTAASTTNLPMAILANTTAPTIPATTVTNQHTTALSALNQ